MTIFVVALTLRQQGEESSYREIIIPTAQDSPLSESTTLWWPADRRPSPPRGDTIARNKFDGLATIDIGYSLGAFLRASSVRLTKECNQSLRLWPRRLHVDVVRKSARVQPDSRIVTVSTQQTDKGATAKP